MIELAKIIVISLSLTSLYDTKLFKFNYDDLNLSLPSSPEFSHYLNIQKGRSGLKPRMELIDLCFLFNDRLVQTAEQALMDSSGTSLGFNAYLLVLWKVLL